MSYFVIYQSDDDLTIECIDTATLKARLNEDWYGTNFLRGIRSENTHLWNTGDVLIIKGEIVVPQAVQVVKEWQL